MKQESENESSEKKKLAILIGASVVALAALVTAGSLILSKISTNSTNTTTGSQEQFVGQAETSQQLQSECQNSALAISKAENIQFAVAEYKKHAENCREVYFTLDEKATVRTEGMYPDLVVDLISKLASTSKKDALDLVEYAKGLPNWQYYMGPIVCDSKAVIAAYEESLNSKTERTCIKKEEFEEKILKQLKVKNFGVLSQTLGDGAVAWLGSPDADVGCPEKMSNILKTVISSADKDAAVKESSDNQAELAPLTVVFRSHGDEDKVVLDFFEAGGCVQLRSALVSGLQTNE